MKRITSISPAIIAAISFGMPGLFSLGGNDNRHHSFMFDGEGDDGGAGQKTEEQLQAEADAEEARINGEIEKLDPKVKAKFEAQQKKQIDDAVAAALAAKTTADAAAATKAQRQKAIDDAKKLGDKEAELEAIRVSAEADKADAARIKAEAQAEKDLVVKERIAAKYKLPEGFGERLHGKDATEWDADAKSLAAVMPVHQTVTREGGEKSGKITPEDQKKSAIKYLPNIPL